ncbi:NADH-quinone oxidoreductase subunit E/NADP-reducing hydrogenase subunit HndA [Desulfohalotomaculum tongense]|uniref:NADH-quinone oxidoreductase subunit NuoE n=1 Tax=Desulforadius tongensis TaxID=1216062 RepID=UPI00195B6585|nr:NADH-quinone oxidoreductase subunit NuoE [Desulforadius tongensis]MBM7855110.1 NADH-quinone oxidoreductase subunit E/NADP-reducing hydrogenase subunit HndA [Desulforadius tongensis]
MGAECNCNCQADSNKKIDELILKYRGNPNGLIVVLAAIQQEMGYLPKDLMIKVAEELNVPLTDVYGVATFYAAFTLRPRGRHSINLCLGTACYVKGAPEVQAAIEKELKIKAGETTEDRRFTFDVVRCLGACGIAPVMTVDGEVHPRMTPEKVSEVLSKYE